MLKTGTASPIDRGGGCSTAAAGKEVSEVVGMK